MDKIVNQICTDKLELKFREPCLKDGFVIFTDGLIVLKAPDSLFKTSYREIKGFPDFEDLWKKKEDNCEIEVPVNIENLVLNPKAPETERKYVEIEKVYFELKHIKILVRISEITDSKIMLIRLHKTDGNKFQIGNASIVLMPLFYNPKKKGAK